MRVLYGIENSPQPLLFQHVFDLDYTGLGELVRSREANREGRLRRAVTVIAKRLYDACPSLEGGWIEIQDETQPVDRDDTFVWDWEVIDTLDGGRKARAKEHGLPEYYLRYR